MPRRTAADHIFWRQLIVDPPPTVRQSAELKFVSPHWPVSATGVSITIDAFSGAVAARYVPLRPTKPKRISPGVRCFSTTFTIPSIGAVDPSR